MSIDQKRHAFHINRSWKIKKSFFDKFVDENDATYLEIEAGGTELINVTHLLMKITSASFKYTLDH